MSLENCQRKFTKRIEGLEHLSYKERLLRLDLTTLLERRARGGLIETFKIIKGIVNYGDGFFRYSRSGRNLLHTSSYKLDNSVNLFKQRVVKYWNMLPCEVKARSNFGKRF